MAAESKKVEKILVPDIGGAVAVEVIEIAVTVGDKINQDDALITLEGDKAAMDVPAPQAGTVKEIKVKIGDKVSAGDVILLLETIDSDNQPKAKKPEKVAEKAVVAEKVEKKPEVTAPVAEQKSDHGDIYAGPAVRRIAQEFDLKLENIPATGEKGRVTKEDVQNYVKQRLQQAEVGQGAVAFTMPAIDFSKFGEIEKQPLTKIKKATSTNMQRNWSTIPHVTQFAEADITELEAFRQQQKHLAEQQKIKLTPLVFIMKAVVAALKEYPMFNSSLSPDGQQLIYKKYFHIGVAVDTPQGLVVPVIRDVESKSLLILAKELDAISSKARGQGLGLADMQGGCFTISSLGGIGGTAFTPIINAPEVAIVGVSKSCYKPVYQASGEFVARLLLPLSLSYDHRVIDGALGARFITYLAQRLEDIRTLLL